MNNAEAVKVLRDFQMWRRGKGKYRWNEDPAKNLPMPNPQVVGEAIDVAISALSRATPPGRRCPKKGA